MLTERRFPIGDGYYIVVAKLGGEGFSRPASVVNISHTVTSEKRLELVDSFTIQEARRLAQALLAATEYAEFGGKGDEDV